jgi:P4 family phage/plasmid primase-like protien
MTKQTDNKDKEPTEEEIGVFWGEDEVVRQNKFGPLINQAITDEGFRDMKQPINVMGQIFLKKYYVTKDISENNYIYNGKYWQTIPFNYLQSLAMNCDTETHTTTSRRKAIVDYALDKTYQLNIPWNKILTEEIAFVDGVYNILTHKKRNHQWEDYLDVITPHKYNQYTKCELWLKCLNDWFETEDKKLAFQEFFGYLLCSHVKYKKALLLLGESNTGKSVPCEIAKYMVGSNATCCIKPEDMDDAKKIAPIKGKKLNLVTELSSNTKLSDGGFKQLISGEGTQIDVKFVAVETTVPVAKHIFATNNLPQIPDASDGVYTRLLIIKFNRIVQVNNRDPNLQDKLKGEIEGIIAWAVEGLKRLVKNNGQFTEIEESRLLLLDYKISQNPILNFIETSGEIERVKEGEKGEIEAEVFRRKFENFKGGKEWAKVTVGKWMRKILGSDSISRNGKRFYPGIRLKENKVRIENTESGVQDLVNLNTEIESDPRDQIPNW